MTTMDGSGLPAPLSAALWETSAPMSGRAVTTVGDAVRTAAASWPERTALVDGADPTRRWTFAELLADTEGVAAGLSTRFSPGEHLAVWAPNSSDWVVLEFGAAMAGLTLVTVNPALGADEAADVLRRSDAVGVVTSRSYRGRDLHSSARSMAADLPALRHVVTLDDLDRPRPHEMPAVTPQEPAQIQFTSGTTGRPKGAVLAHQALVDDAWQFATAIGGGVGDVWINPMPLFHTAGCGLATLGALQTGGCQVVMASFDPDVLLDLVAAERATITLTVPTMLVRVLDAARARPRELASMHTWALGGAPVAPELIRRARTAIDARYTIGFGQTEAAPYITHTWPHDPHPQWDETVGRPLPHVSVRVVSPTTGETLAIGEVGELCTRSPCVMIGYYRDEVATREAIDPEGWLHTGDLATMDRYGYVRIVGRLRDIIIRGGENVYPREIEDLLLTHPAVIDVAIVGRPDPEWGELVAAFVHAREPVEASSLERYCRDHLAPFKVPRTWRFVDEFPMTASGKIRKTDLRERLAADT